MLEEIIYHNTVLQWIITLSIIIGVIIICKILSLINKKLIVKITKRTKTKLDDILFSSLEKPIIIIILLIGFFIAYKQLSFPEEIETNINKILRFLLIISLTWAISSFVIGIFDHTGQKNSQKNPDFKRLSPLIKRTITIIIWLLGIITALNNIGVNIATLLGTLGIGGLAVALASQDTIKNIIGGITLISDRPFKIGDRIKFNNIDGTVTDIGLRSTKILTLDKRIITIANSQIVDSPIENISGEESRRVVLNLGLTYNTTIEKLNLAIKLLQGIPENVKFIDKNVSATFQNFGNSALIITLIYHIETNSPDLMESISDVNFYILSVFNENKLDFAYQTQTIYTKAIE